MLPQKMLSESVKLQQAPLLDLYDVDITQLGGEVFRFHNGTNAKRETLVWRGKSYRPYPVKGSGFDLKGRGTSSRPKLTLANINGLLTGLTLEFEELVGAIVTRRQMYLHHLDSVNFPEGNSDADETQEVVSRFVVERLVNIDAMSASFEMALPCETDKAIIPARMITTDVCSWQYRDNDCGYSGGAVADEDDRPTTDLNKDKCSKRLGSCKLRFGANSPLPFGGFPTTIR
ncbi:phage minor tail protein L [Vibrio barjaei]|uniref:Phage minor tail protein L n=1 Tax=Vibrio barjaei TaxID=1676683 RepID=A0ABW7ID25_9VIBR